MALVVTAALTFTPISHDIQPPCPEPLQEFWSTCITPHAARWIPTAYREEARHDSTFGDVTTPPPTGVEQWRPLVAAYWPVEHVDRMLRIMACESGGDPDIPNQQGSGALGLFQIMPFWQKAWPGDYTDPWTNAAVAYQIWLEQGYAAWVCKG